LPSIPTEYSWDVWLAQPRAWSEFHAGTVLVYSSVYSWDVRITRGTSHYEQYEPRANDVSNMIKKHHNKIPLPGWKQIEMTQEETRVSMDDHGYPIDKCRIYTFA
jgi:hypothetical protein